MTKNDMIEVAGILETIKDGRKYQPGMRQAGIQVDDGHGTGLVKWNTRNSAFCVLDLYWDSMSERPKNIKDLIGKTAVIKDDLPISQGIIELSHHAKNGLWLRFKK
jgi:hypothetical protein